MDVKQLADKVLDNVAKVIVGKDREIKLILTGVIAGGHVLMEDVPGTGKTVMAKALAASISCDFKRLQFTPDLLPSDVTGLSVYDAKQGDFVFKPGPVFTNVLLADEINRATPRTQSALLECMEERQVTVDGKTMKLDDPFLVIATQNPIETQGTFPLPEAQLDRFLMKLSLGRLSREDAVNVLDRFVKNDPLKSLEPVCAVGDVISARRECENCLVSRPVMEYIAELCRNTHSAEGVMLGVSPRGMLALMRAARAYAMISGRDFVTPDDVKELALPVLSHRLAVKAIYGQKDAADNAVKQAMEMTEAPTESLKQ